MRDGRRQRLGLATGTANPNDEDVSTTGIGSLINMGDLYTNSVADQNATTGNQAYLDRILDEAGPQTLNLDPGAYVDTRDNRYINDAYNYYLGGGTGEVPTDTAEIPGAIDTLVDVGDGDGGQATIPGAINTVVTPPNITPTNLNDYEGIDDTTMPSNLTSDMVGNIDTTPVDTYTSATGNVAPDGTTMANMTDDVDMNAIDNPFAGTPVNTPSGNNPFGYEDPQSLAIGPSGAVDFGTGGLEDEGQDIGEEFDDTPVSTPSGNNPFGYEDLNPSALAGPGINETSGLDDIGQDIGIDDTVDYGMPQGSPGQLNPAAPDVDVTTPSVDYSEFDDLEADPGAYGTVNEVTDDPTMQETISNAFTSARQGIGDLAEAGVDQIQEVGQSIANTIGGIYNGVDQTISVFGKEINVPTTLAGIALNQVVGAPISLAFGALKAIGGMLPTGVSSIEYDSYNDSQKGAIDEAYGPGGVMDGYNVESAFGKGAKATVQERLENRTSKGIFDSTTDKLNDLSAKLGGITVTAPAYDFDDTTTTTTTPAGDTVDVETGDITNDVGVTVGNINDEFGEGVATEQAAADVAASNAASVSMGADRYGDGGPGGGGGGNGGGNGGNGGGTHVCTASYANGFITQPDFKILKKYGIFLRRNDPYLMKAYDWFGPKLANKVKNGKLFNFAKHSTNMWKYNQTKQKNVSFNIKFMSAVHKIITRPILRVIGIVLKLTEKFIK